MKFNKKKYMKKYQKKYRIENRDRNKKYQKKYRVENKETIKLKASIKIKTAKNIIGALKINGCSICGYNECDAALDFHHVNPKDKIFQINLTTMRTKDEKIFNELNKCILLCSNCHRKIEEISRRK
jgi:hypothetical protein